MHDLHHSLDEWELTGRRRTHIIDAGDPSCALHRLVMPAFLAMREAARRDGIDLQAASSFRDFDRQLTIWNAKFRGERPLLDRSGQLLNVASLSAAQRIEAILIWSALPGASRHHWGTDLDVYDAAALHDRARLQLIPEEYGGAGPFATLTAWLDQHMHRFGFFRPYVEAGSAGASIGVSPEPWHLSFAPLSTLFLDQLTPTLLSRAVQSSSIEGQELLLSRIDELHQQFVMQVAAPSPASLAVEFSDHGRMV